ncbi:thiamine phosphate synthase [Effusibacillus lacus]|uniref:thiamine phosphate synthase n=1 Tax=Effusibacillus lacus TaxID=1348429 RepID=UPI000BB91306
MRFLDSRLYVITGSAFLKGRKLEDVILQAIGGGADCIQLREKDVSSRELLEMAVLLRKLTKETGTTFIVNDRVDIAQAVGADGVHLGQQDLPIAVAREILGPDKIIGISTHDSKEAIEAERSGANYIGLGPVHPTPTKSDAEPAIGLQGIREVCRHVSIPVVAIGGIKQKDVEDIIRSGASGVAVISAVIGADDVHAAAKAMRDAVDRVRKEGIGHGSYYQRSIEDGARRKDAGRRSQTLRADGKDHCH